MTKRVTFSNSNLELAEIWDYYYVSEEALKEYYKNIESGKLREKKFFGLTSEELWSDFKHKLTELETSVSFSVLSAIEALLRIDFLNRVYKKSRDQLSREFRKLYLQKSYKASLEEDILELWKQHHPSLKRIISDYKGALNLRNWLAHGRYWTPKFGRKYDFGTIFTIAERIDLNLQLSK